MDRRLQLRYVKLVKAHMSSSSTTAAGPAIAADGTAGATATQAAWRFFNNDRVELAALAEPLREAGRVGCLHSESEFVLLAHDWSKLDYKSHEAKQDKRQLTHEHDIGYDLTTALLVDAQTGSPLAPMQMHVRTADAVYSTSESPPAADDHHLNQLSPTMEEVANWKLSRQVVHVIDREADSLGDFREWAPAGHLFLVRCDDRRVLWNGASWLISEMVEDFDRAEEFEDVREVLFQGTAARQEVAEATIVLDRPHKTRIDGKQRNIAGKPLEVRLIAARVVDSDGYILAEWTLLTNVGAPGADAAQIALWYYWRWRIESFFKLLKSHGLQVEHWQQECGEAITRRLLVAAMACVVVWNLEREETPEAEKTKQLLVRLSGRRMKRSVPYTAPALLAGYFVMLSMCDLLEHSDYDLRKLKTLAANAWPFLDTT
jgi:Transposase DDE domain